VESFLKKLPLLTIAALGIASVAQAASAGTADDHARRTPIYGVPAPRNLDLRNVDAMSKAGKTVPTFTSSIVSPLDGKTYTFHIMGTDPTKTPASTTVTYQPISIVWTFPNGVVLDPRNPGCNDTVSVNNRFFGSPLFQKVPLTSNGINVGTTQIIDGFQRAEFWSYIKGSASYHVLLHAATPLKPIIVNETAPSGSTTATGQCSGTGHDLGEIPYASYDAILQAVTNKYVKSTATLPIIMSYNVVETESGECCIIGYHNAYSRNGGIQVYATGAYTEAGTFNVPIEDIHAYTHEIGETFNDPFVQAENTENLTPAWGHVGQQSGCQNNLEVGDPLTGTPFLVTYKGFTYHPQELAYFSWFFRQKPSVGTAGKYSFEGTFTSAQGACS
jgi:hypothetical protein